MEEAIKGTEDMEEAITCMEDMEEAITCMEEAIPRMEETEDGFMEEDITIEEFIGVIMEDLATILHGGGFQIGIFGFTLTKHVKS